MSVTSDSETTAEIGRRRLRKEDARLITGRNHYTDSMSRVGMLTLGMVRSPVAHAKITRLDVSAAKASPGVVDVLTGPDLADSQGSLPNAWPVTPDQKAPAHPAVAIDEVVFAGEIVAVVIARTAAQARDAIELVDVDYDDLPVVVDLEAAERDEELVHPDLGTNTSSCGSSIRPRPVPAAMCSKRSPTPTSSSNARCTNNG